MYIFDKNNILYHVSFGNHNKVGLTFYEKFIVERDTKSTVFSDFLRQNIYEVESVYEFLKKYLSNNIKVKAYRENKTLAKLILESIEESKINNALEQVLLSYWFKKRTKIVLFLFTLKLFGKKNIHYIQVQIRKKGD